jgi:hypothetical protein
MELDSNSNPSSTLGKLLVFPKATAPHLQIEIIMQVVLKNE